MIGFFFFFISSSCAYPLGALLLWSGSGATQAMFSAHLKARPILECYNSIRHCLPQALTVARTNGSVSYLVLSMGERLGPFLFSLPSFFLEKIPALCQGSSSILHFSGYVFLSHMSFTLVFLINYITASASYCIRTYCPGPKGSQETYNARQQHLLSPSHQTTSNCNTRLYFLDMHDGKFKNFSIGTH